MIARFDVMILFVLGAGLDEYLYCRAAVHMHAKVSVRCCAVQPLSALCVPAEFSIDILVHAYLL